jgi:hypothetical protein
VDTNAVLLLLQQCCILSDDLLQNALPGTHATVPLGPGISVEDAGMHNYVYAADMLVQPVIVELTASAVCCSCGNIGSWT